MRTLFALLVGIGFTFIGSEFADWMAYLLDFAAPEGWKRATLQAVFIAAMTTLAWFLIRRLERSE